MEDFSITKSAQGFHIEGFPEAVKVLRISGPKSQRLADLALHKSDLDFALDRHFPDDIQLSGNCTTVPPPRERYPL